MSDEVEVYRDDTQTVTVQGKWQNIRSIVQDFVDVVKK